MMQLRKTNYEHIRFPVAPNLEGRKKLDLYLKELNIHEPLYWKAVIVILVNVYSDFYENKINGRILSSVAFELLVSLSKQSGDWGDVRDPTLKLLLSDIDNYLDIEWLQNSVYFGKLKEEMIKRLDQYEEYHEKSL